MQQMDVADYAADFRHIAVVPSPRLSHGAAHTVGHLVKRTAVYQHILVNGAHYGAVYIGVVFHILVKSL